MISYVARVGSLVAWHSLTGKPAGNGAFRILIREMVRSRKGLISPQDVARAGGLLIPDAGEDVERLRAIADSQLAVVNAHSASAAR